MIHEHFIKQLNFFFTYQPTISQEILIKNIALFCTSQNFDEILLVNGYAGTGKTYVMSAAVKMFTEIGRKSVLLAPTGRAAKVLSNYSNQSAYTIHKKIYRQKSTKDGFGEFVLDKNLHTNTIFIVDEGSMISNDKLESSIFGTGKLLDDLIEYIYTGKNCKLIMIGDKAQLPPVGAELSPALDKKYLEKNYLMNVIEVELTDIVRQEQNSMILKNATAVRELIKKKKIQYPKFILPECDDFFSINGDTLLENINEMYEKYGMDQVIIINRSNKTANKYNLGIRNRILFREEELVSGDILMVVKNNYYWTDKEKDIDFIANGDILEIKKIKKYYSVYGYHFADITFKLIDYNIELDAKILLDTLTIDTASLTSNQNKDFFYSVYEDFKECKPKKKRF